MCSTVARVMENRQNRLMSPKNPKAESTVLENPLETAKPSLTSLAYRVLEEQIVTLELRPGAVLSEVALAKSLSIGRTPVREAIQRLATEGLVTILPRRGVLVSEINLEQQVQLLKVRRELERLIASEASVRRTEEQASVFCDLAAGFDSASVANDDVKFMRLDRSLNKALLEACDNQFATKAMRNMQGLSRRFWFYHYRKFLDLSRCAVVHAGVSRAVAEGNPEAAADASDRLIDYIEEFSRSTL